MKKLCETLFIFNLDQHINKPTHKKGHTLDLAITRAGELDVLDIQNHGPIISDHALIAFKLPIEKSAPSVQKTIFRDLDNIDPDKFNSDIMNSDLYQNPEHDLDSLVEQYNHTLSDLLEKHAPMKFKTKRARPPAPWYGADIKNAKMLTYR